MNLSRYETVIRRHGQNLAAIEKFSEGRKTMKRENKNKPEPVLLLLISAALTLGSAGCATHYVHQRHEAQFLPDPADAKTVVACHVVLTQTDPFIAARQTTPWQVPYDANHGLVGLAVDFAMNEALKGANNVANEIRREQAMKRSAPLQGHGLGPWFDAEVHSSLAGALDSSPWLHALPLEMRRDNREVTVAERNEHPILDIRLIYHLSYDASRLIVQARLFYSKQGETNTEHVCYYTFFSEAVGPEKNEAAVAEWVSGDNQLLRQRMSEGLAQITDMLNLDFLRPEWRDPAVPSETISCWDALSLQRIKLKGHTFSKAGSRIIFQTERQTEQASYLYSLIPN